MNAQAPTLAGKTIFITGASRGIGLAMAERFARDGANLILTGKTLSQHASLPGSLQATAERVRAAGGQALALAMDVRDEGSVRQAAEQGAQHFGGIDVCVNNAGAFWLQPSMQTSFKRHDLLFGVNERGCYLATQACHPYLRQAANPHILNISPPLDLRAVWLQHTSLVEAAVFAQPDDQTGEAVVAVVVLAHGATLSAEEVRSHVASRLAAYKVPKQVHVRLDSLPRTRRARCSRPCSSANTPQSDKGLVAPCHPVDKGGAKRQRHGSSFWQKVPPALAQNAPAAHFFIAKTVVCCS